MIVLRLDEKDKLTEALLVVVVTDRLAAEEKVRALPNDDCYVRIAQ